MANRLFAWSGEVPAADEKFDIPLRYQQTLAARPYQWVHVQQFFQLRGPSSAGVSDPTTTVQDHLAINLHDGRDDTFAAIKRPAPPNSTSGFVLGFGGLPRLFN